MSDVTGKITWVPSILIDEYTPEGRATPEAWMVALKDQQDMHDGDEEIMKLFNAGDKINMTCFEEFAPFLITVNEAGEIVGGDRCPFTLDMFDAAPEPPADRASRHPRANHFWLLEDYDIMGDFEDCLGQFAEAVRSGWYEMRGRTTDIMLGQCYQGDEVAFLINPDFSLTRL